MPEPGIPEPAKKISWRGGLYLVGPDPLTSLFYASGLLLTAGVGYASPLFIIGLYAMLFMLAPLYIEAVLMTLSNGGTYNMVRTALQRKPFASMSLSALVGVITSVSYIATAIVSQLSFSHYVLALTEWTDAYRVPLGVIYSAIPSLGFGLWVMWSNRWKVLQTVLLTTVVGILLSPMLPRTVVVMLNPIMLLFSLNNRGLRESVAVSKIIFLFHLGVMAVFIVVGLTYAYQVGFDFDRIMSGTHEMPGLDGLTLALVIAGLGNAILGASGVESVMQIPEELDDPKTAVPKVYNWMLSILLGFGGLVTLTIFFVLDPVELLKGRDFLVSMAGDKSMTGISGSVMLGTLFKTVIVIDAALVLIAATNTSFAGIRGLWVTMAKDHLMPRFFLRTDSKLGTHKNIHIVFLAGIALLAIGANANLEVLGHWYGGTFGLVLLSGVIGIVLLRYYLPTAPRPYRAPLDVNVAGTSIPLGAFVGLVVIGGALVSLHLSARPDVERLQELLTYLLVAVAIVIAYYAHPAWIRKWHHYRDQLLLEHRGALNLDRQRAVAVCVGGYRARERVVFMLEYAAMQQYPHLVVLHATDTTEHVQVYDPHDSATRYLAVPGLNSRRILETLSTVPQIEEVQLHVVMIPVGVHASWQDAVNEFLSEAPEIHFVATGPGELLEARFAKVLTIDTD
jgi:amino acid transporter